MVITVPCILKKINKLGTDLRCSLYISEREILVVPLYISQNGLIVESRKIQSLNINNNLEILGRTVVESLMKYERKSLNLNNHKSRDWPAFQVSKLKTIVEFKNKYTYISIDTVNKTSLLSIEGYSKSQKFTGFTVRKLIACPVSPSIGETSLGNYIIKVYQATRFLDES